MKIKQYSIRLGHDYFNNESQRQGNRCEFNPITLKSPTFFPDMESVREAYDEICETYGLGLLHDCETVVTNLEL